jgi:hypothetical protein
VPVPLVSLHKTTISFRGDHEPIRSTSLAALERVATVDARRPAGAVRVRSLPPGNGSVGCRKPGGAER